MSLDLVLCQVYFLSLSLSKLGLGLGLGVCGQTGVCLAHTGHMVGVSEERKQPFISSGFFGKALENCRTGVRARRAKTLLALHERTYASNQQEVDVVAELNHSAEEMVSGVRQCIAVVGPRLSTSD